MQQLKRSTAMNAQTMTAVMTMLLGAAGSAHAGFLDLEIDPNTYPSAQGWTFFSQNLEEGEAVWLTEAVTSLDAFGAGDLSEARFDLFLTPETFEGVTEIRMRTHLRVLELESFGEPEKNGAVSLVGVGGGAAAALRFDDERVFTDDGHVIERDMTEWRTFEMRVDTASREMRLLVDNTLVYTGVAAEGEGTYFQLAEGYRTNVHAELALMRWTLIPTPGTGAAVALGALFAARRRR